jgi:multidrug efflux pump subunit AcrA (membrane-fusion protein)
MSFAIVASLIAVGTTVSAYGQVQAGKAAEEQAIEQARQEKIAAEGRELQRRQELNKALASNIVGASMSGETGEGSTASLSLESAKQIGTSEAVIGLSERLKTAQTLRKARMAKGTANIGAASTLLKGTATVAGQLA